MQIVTGGAAVQMSVAEEAATTDQAAAVSVSGMFYQYYFGGLQSTMQYYNLQYTIYNISTQVIVDRSALGL